MKTTLKKANKIKTLDVNIPPVKPVFARHETFHPRFGWLKKGFDAAEKNATPHLPSSLGRGTSIFLEQDASIRLGVGKNMVNSIRYWCNSFKILEEDQPTEFGRKLLSDDGWDPFLENSASLWLLHWNLLKPTCQVASWYFVFNIFTKNEFTAETVLAELKKYSEILGSSVVETSLNKDINCILRMYAMENLQGAAIEDSLNSPFTELKLIQKLDNSKEYSFGVKVKKNLPAEIIIYACLEFAHSVTYGQKTISLSQLLYTPGSPGMVFKLSEYALLEAIETIQNKFNQIFLSDTAGLRQLSFKENPRNLANTILELYYQGAY